MKRRSCLEKEIERDGTIYRLSEIRTEVVKEENGKTGEDTIEVASSPFLEEMADTNKPEDKILQDGNTYLLVDARLEESTIPAHEVSVREEVVYEAVEAKDVIPSKIQVTVTDEVTGQKLEGIAEASSQKFGGERWEDTFSFPVTFHEYGIDGYWLGEKIFRLEGDAPDFKGYEKELLALIDVSEEDYQVDAAAWNGEAYEDSTGVLCRNAVVTGKKLVNDCTVVYEGSEVFPEENGVRYIAAYKKGRCFWGRNTSVYNEGYGSVCSETRERCSLSGDHRIVGSGSRNRSLHTLSKKNENCSNLEPITRI